MMPLKALVDGEVVNSWQCSDEKWASLRSAQKCGGVEISFSCCDARVIMREGSRIKHFAHYRRPKDCKWKPESQEHEELKYIIAKACHEAGWETDTEVEGPGYRADVLAQKDGMKIAFEVQLSRQSLAATLERRDRLVNDGVRDYWLFKKLPATGIKGKIPKRCNQLVKFRSEWHIQYVKSKKPLTDFVKNVLSTAEQGFDRHEAKWVDSSTIDYDSDLKALDAFAALIGLGVIALIWSLISATLKPKKRIYISRKSRSKHRF